MVRAELNGDEAPAIIAQRTVLVLSGAQYKVQFDGITSDQGTFEIEPIRRNQKLNLTGTFGPNKGKSLACIFQHVGERLRICYGLDGITPDDFKTAGCQNRYLVTYRRLPTKKSL